MQEEYAHLGSIKSAQDLLNAARIPWNIRDAPWHDHCDLSCSHFWVGSPCFWGKYVEAILKPITLFLKAEPDFQL